MKVPDGWRVATLGELVEVLDSRRIPIKAADRALRPGKVPYYGATGQVGTIDEPLFNESLVLLGEDGVQFLTPGKRKAYRINGPAWVNNHAHVLRPSKSVDETYLTHWLNAADYRGFAYGTTRLKLTQSAMKRLPVAFPPLPEQRRIIERIEELFTHLDAAEAGLEKAEMRAQQLVAASAAELVGKAQESGPVSPIGDHALRVEYGSSSKTHSDPHDSVPVLRMGNIQQGLLDWESLKYLPADHSEFPKLLLQPGDLLFNRTNSAELVGKSAVFDGRTEASFASYLIRVRFDESVVPEWASLVINSPYGRAYIKTVVSQQVGQANVNGTKLKAFPLPLPDTATQSALVSQHRDRLSEAKRTREAGKRAQQRSSALRRSILAAAFEGRLV